MRSFHLRSKLLALLFIPYSSWAFNADFKTVNNRVPLEFSHLFDSMKLQVKTPAEKMRLVGIAGELNQNLSFLPKDHIFMLMKSEVTKNLLEHKFSKVRQFDVSTLLLERIESNFSRKERLLNPFAQWIYRSVIAELKARKEQGLLTNKTFDPAAFEGKKRAEAQRFQRYLNYLLPWIDRMDALSAADFNELTKTVGWQILERLNNRSLLFKRYSSTAAGDAELPIFNIPPKLTDLHPEDIKRAKKNDEPASLKEASQREKTEASTEVENVSPEDLSPVSDEVSKELEKVTEPGIR